MTDDWEEYLSLAREKLVDLASDNLALYQETHTWFLEQGQAAIPVLLEGLRDERLGSVGHWRILLLLQHFAQADTLPAILDVFYRALERRDPILLPAAMGALAQFRDPAANEALTALLQESDPDTVKYAAFLLGKSGAANAVASLSQLLDSNDSSVRYSAVQGLIELDNREARLVLKRHLEQESNMDVRASIISAGIRENT